MTNPYKFQDKIWVKGVYTWCSHKHCFSNMVQWTIFWYMANREASSVVEKHDDLVPGQGLLGILISPKQIEANCSKGFNHSSIFNMRSNYCKAIFSLQIRRQSSKWAACCCVQNCCVQFSQTHKYHRCYQVTLQVVNNLRNAQNMPRVETFTDAAGHVDC